MKSFINFIKLLIVILYFTGCFDDHKQKEVIIYTSVDQVYSSKIFKDFEQKTGIKVLAVYDTEASKAIGLEKRIMAEEKHPRADIFWNSEPIRTERLSKLGFFQPFLDIQLPTYRNSFYCSCDKTWFGLGERKRVIVVNTNLVPKEDFPIHLSDIWSDRFKGKVAISSPYIGTASTHFAALYHQIGKENFIELLLKIKQSNCVFLAGNSVVKDAVGAGKYLVGLVDSDDVIAGINAGLPIKAIYYDQDTKGCFSIFGTVAMLKFAPHQNEAKVFMQYLLTKEIEQKLINMGAVQFSVFKSFKKNSYPKGWLDNPKELSDILKDSKELMKEYL